MTFPSADKELIQCTAQIVASYVGNNSVSTPELSDLIAGVHRSLVALTQPPTLVEEKPQPAVPIKKSVTPDYIVCLEDGKQLKMLKRHLKTAYNMTPEEYRERWGLAADYPMVAPNYAERRSELAKKIGLGTRGSRGG